MKKLIFALTLLLTSNAFAATGSGHAQAELAKPLSVTETTTANLGSISIDPAAGEQTVSQDYTGPVTCPPTYACSGSTWPSTIQINGAISTMVYISISGSTATLSDGNGNTITFDPHFAFIPTDTISQSTNLSGKTAFNVGGTLYFTGNEPAGTYNTTNAGGSGYTVTVNY